MSYLSYLDGKIINLIGINYLVLLHRTSYHGMSYRGSVIELETVYKFQQTYKFRSGGRRYILTADGERIVSITPLDEWVKEHTKEERSDT